MSSKLPLRGFAALILGLGVLVSLTLWRVQLKRQGELLVAQFQIDAETYIRAIDRELRAGVDALLSLESFYAGSERVDSDEFAAFCVPTIHRHAAVDALFWCPRVLPAGLADHEKQARDEGLEAYAVRGWAGRVDSQAEPPAPGLGLPPDGAAFPVRFVQPNVKAPHWLGVDLRRLPGVEAAMGSAALHGTPQAAPAAVMTRTDGVERTLYLVVVPLYDRRAVHPNAESRRSSLTGFLVAALSLQALVDSALRELPLLAVDLWLDEMPLEREVLALRVSMGRAQRQTVPKRAGRLAPGQVMHQTASRVADRVLRVSAAPAPSYLSDHRGSGPAASLLAALLCSLALAGYVASLHGRQQAVQATVERRTRELTRANAQLESEVAGRRRYEQALRDSEMLYHSTVELLPMCVYRKDAEGRVTFANLNYCRFMGRSLDQVLGRDDSDLLGLERARKHQEDDRRVMQTTEVFHEVEELTGDDGQPRHLEVLKTAVRDAAGQVAGVQGVFWDITARRQADEARRDAEALYHTMIDSLPMKFFRKDLQGRFILGNAGFCQELGRPLDQVLGRTDHDFFPPQLAAKYIEDDRRICASQTTFHDVERHDLPDGSVRYVEVIKTPVRDHRGAIVGIQGAYWDVTERKLAEDELLRLADIVASSEDAIIALRLDGTITHWNPGAEHMYQYTAAEVRGRHVSLLAPEALRTEVVDNLARIAQGEKVEHYTTQRLRKDGGLIHVSLSVSPIRDAQGRIVGASTIARDITATTLAAQQLRESEERFRQLAEHVHEVFWITSADGSSMIYVSPAYESIWGRTCQSLYEDPSGWVRAIHSDDRDRVSRLFHDKAALGGFDTEYRVVRPDGAVRWIHDRGFPVRDENGMVYRIAGTAEDITRSKRIEEQLRASQALHQSLIDHLPDLIMVKDAQGRFLTANPALVHALGLSDLRDLLGRTDWDFFSPELAGQYARDEQTILSTGVPMLNHEERCIIGGRQVWNLTTKVPLLDAAGRTTGLVGITRDITESKRQRQALEETAAALERSNAELQQFAYVASHDLQEPLRMISSYCQLLERRYKGRLDEQADKFIAYAVDGARRMQTLIRDLLAYSRVETSPRQMAAVDLNQAAALALANLAMLLQDSQAKVTIEPLPTVSGDRTLLTQLLQNLINNAIKFRGDRTPEVHVSSQPQGDFHRITVRDNGIGIAQEHHAKVFQIFKRLHSREQYEGTGIGLAVCKRVVEKHGGEIWIESTPGQGSAFHFTLRPPPPNASPEPTPESPNASPTPEPA